MAKRKVFVSYWHAQKEWVRDRLVPCLDGVEAEVLIDYRRFGAGRPLPAQMDALVDEADVNLLVFSPDYLASPNCQHEMNRLLERECRVEGELAYLRQFRRNEMQDPPEDDEIGRSLRRRWLTRETPEGRYRLRVPLMRRWLRERA